MKKTLLALIPLIFSIGFTNCNRRPKPASSMLGQYEFVGVDHSGKRAFTGTIALTYQKGTFANGQCKIIKERDAALTIWDENPRCEATLDGNKITIDFAPSLYDAGLIFEGDLGDDRMVGHWMFKSVVGSVPEGKFDAVKKL
jgi:hypothetical protein